MACIRRSQPLLCIQAGHLLQWQMCRKPKQTTNDSSHREGGSALVGHSMTAAHPFIDVCTGITFVSRQCVASVTVSCHHLCLMYYYTYWIHTPTKQACATGWMDAWRCKFIVFHADAKPIVRRLTQSSTLNSKLDSKNSPGQSAPLLIFSQSG